MIINIEIKRLLPHPKNPRRDLGDLSELTDSVRIDGILQNLTVVPVDPERYKAQIGRKKAYEGNYTIIIGHRRHAAAKLAGLTEIPCSISDMEEKKQISTMLLENVQRVDLKYSEQAQGFQLLLDLGETEASISELTGFSKSTVKRRIGLLKFPADKFEKAEARGATLDDFAKLDKIKDDKLRNSLLEAIATNSFEWKLKESIEKEKKKENKKKMLQAVKEFAEERKTGETKDLEFVNYIGFTSSNKVVKPQDADKKKYYVVAEESGLYLYKEKPKEKGAKKSTSEPISTPQKTEAEREKDERIAKLNELSKRAYQTRYDFIKNFNPKKEHYQAIFEFAGRAIFEQFLDEGMTFEMLGFNEDDLQDEEYYSISRLAFKANTSFEKVLTVMSYCSLDDNRQTFHNSHSGTHAVSNALNYTYYHLLKLGYKVSDEEKELMDGTHELFDKE